MGTQIRAIIGDVDERKSRTASQGTGAGPLYGPPVIGSGSLSPTSATTLLGALGNRQPSNTSMLR